MKRPPQQPAHVSTQHQPTAEELAHAIGVVQSAVGDARAGLPTSVFLMLSAMTPLCNVDLLIRDSTGRTLLTWRDDGFYGPGWHLPGGIVRFKELLPTRIQAVALAEIGVAVQTQPMPLCMHEVRHTERDVRGHFLSLLFSCTLTSSPPLEEQFNASTPMNGAWSWHAECPDNLIPVHNMYRPWLQTVEAAPIQPALISKLARQFPPPPWAQTSRLFPLPSSDDHQFHRP
jgi:colanic acid biosynthesis protein WcaH